MFRSISRLRPTEQDSTALKPSDLNSSDQNSSANTNGQITSGHAVFSQSAPQRAAAQPNNAAAASQGLPAEMRGILDSLGHLKPNTDIYATEFVDQLLAFAHRVRTSDVHLQPTADGFSVSFRNNGVLQQLGEFQVGASSSIVARLKVIADLLTYQNDLPQEGRISEANEGGEVRVSTFPTLYGERAVLRFFGHSGDFQLLEDLGHAPEVTRQIEDALTETSGALIVSGPAGSGKSTTLYACLRELVEWTGGNRSILSIEDPIEVPVKGVAQSQVNTAAGFDLNTGLKSLLRQDPEVIMIGEIRDPDTAETAIQACLTGQLMMTSFHADSSATAISRLIDLGIEPYLLRSGLIGVLSQRLLRTLCDCSEESTDESDRYGLPIDWCRTPTGCDKCNQSGYQGRVIVSEFLSFRDPSMADRIMEARDSRSIYRVATESGMKSLWERATELVREGRTSPKEVRRVLGVSMRI